MLLPGCWFRMPWARATLRASCRCSLFSKAKTVCSILGRGYHRSVRLIWIKTKKPPASFAISPSCSHVFFPCLPIKSINMCPHVFPFSFPCFPSSLTMLVRFLFQPVAVCFLCLVDVFRPILMFGSLFTQFPFGGS